MTTGTKDRTWWDRWKIKVLAVLGALALYMVYTNLFSGPSAPGPGGTPDRPVTAGKAADGPIAMVGAVPKSAARPKAVTRGRSDEFHPVYLNNRPELRPDPATIDPTMRWDLLAKVQGVDAAGGKRNLFAFGTPPPPVKLAEGPQGKEPSVALGPGGRGVPGPAGPPGPPGEPPLQINLKYYGIVAYTQGGKKTACFLDGEEILLGSEGDTLKRRYRLVRIGNASVVMQDIESKREATIPLAQEAKV
ncbi:MAG: hypothetical protein ACLQU1_09615 [Bryobacteraceae bacterium]